MALPVNLQICRTCVLKSPNMLCIFGEGALGCSIADLINELLDLNVCPGDGLPDKICCSCLNELARFKKFKNISHEAKVTLEYILKKDKSETVPQALKNESDESKGDCSQDVQVVDLNDSSDDDSGAETVCAPSSPTLSLSSDSDVSICCYEDMVVDDDVEIINEASTSTAKHSKVLTPPKNLEKIIGSSTSTAVFLPVGITLEESFPSDEGKTLVCEDPLSTEHLDIEDIFPQNEDNGSDSGSIVIDVGDYEEPIDFRLLEHCSRTLGWTRKSETAVVERSSRLKDDRNIPAGTDDSSNTSAPTDEDQSEKTSKKSSGWDIKRCLQCSVKFKNVSELKEHVKKKECYVIRCSFCDILLLRPQLQEHVKSCIKKPLPYCCLICKKSFSLMRALSGHLACHTENKRGLCFVCGKEFSTMKNLKAHRKKCILGTVRPEVQFPILRCGECSSAYTKIASLRWHQRNKKHYSCLCGDCGISCPSYYALCSHIEANHPNYCHSCQKCGKRFVDASRLKRHISVCSTDKKCK